MGIKDAPEDNTSGVGCLNLMDGCSMAVFAVYDFQLAVEGLTRCPICVFYLS
jgi:hypothetical protein